MDFCFWLQYDATEQKKVIDQLWKELCDKSLEAGYVPVMDGEKVVRWQYDPTLDTRNRVS